MQLHKELQLAMQLVIQPGIEPDQGFYSQNEAAVRGKNRIDLAVEPPPDLALEKVGKLVATQR